MHCVVILGFSKSIIELVEIFSSKYACCQAAWIHIPSLHPYTQPASIHPVCIHPYTQPASIHTPSLHPNTQPASTHTACIHSPSLHPFTQSASIHPACFIHAPSLHSSIHTPSLHPFTQLHSYTHQHSYMQCSDCFWILKLQPSWPFPLIIYICEMRDALLFKVLHIPLIEDRNQSWLLYRRTQCIEYVYDGDWLCQN